VSAHLHDDEPDNGPKIVRALLRQQAPDIARLPIDPLSNTGSDNALYRIGTD